MGRGFMTGKPVVLAVVSDIHAGGATAVCPPHISLDDGGQYVASKQQQWLWQSWLSYWERVKAVRDREDARLVEVFNGDLVDGIPHQSVQILSGNPNAQAAVFTECMRIPLDLEPSAICVVRGTEAHVGKSAAAEERIADGLRRDKRPIIADPDTGTASQWHARMEINDVRIDFAHHGRVGTRPWTRINVTANLAAEIFYEHAARGEPHPHLAIRSHFHRYGDTGGAHPTRVIQTGAWQLATAFVNRIAPDSLADIGGLIVVVRDGTFDVEPVLFKPQAASVWRMPAWGSPL